jgi:hypothetical protein
MKEFFIPTKKNNYKPYLLKKAVLVFYAVILVVVNTFGGVFGISQVSASDIKSATIVSLTNQERSAAGLNTLNINSKLTAAAQAKAENMFEEQYWDHFGPNGETPWQFITGAGYNYVYAGENLAKGFRTSEGVVEGLMASPTHRENILSKNYKDIGVAVKRGILLGKETTLVVQMFGNLTSEVYGSSTENSESSQSDETETPTTQTPTVQSPVIESGQIKAISITHPKTGDILKDSSMLIKGNVQGDDIDYTVELYDLEEKISEFEDNSQKWQYSSEENWDEGDHSIEAQVKGSNVISDAVLFTVDTTPPMIIRDSLQIVHEGDSYTLTFESSENWYEIEVANGDEEISFLKDETDEIQLVNFNPSEKIVLTIYDEAGNSSELDISEYFLEGQSDEYSTFNLSMLINSIRSTDGINIVVASLLLILMSMEVFVLWRKGKLGKNIGDVFVIALWITILTIGIFKGFGDIAI